MPERDRRRCSHCLKVKPLAAFYATSSWCRTCHRLGSAERRRTPEHKAQQAEYRARPEVKARHAERDRLRERLDATKARRRAYKATVAGRMLRARREATYRLRRATTDAKRARLLDLIAAYDRELLRHAARTDSISTF